MLLQAEQALTATPDEARSPWVSHFDEGSLASEAARCFRELGEHQEAQRQAERIIQLRPGDRTRSRASGQLLLVRVLIAQGKPEEACAVAREVLDATQQLGSYLVIQQLLDLKQLLEPHRGNCNRVSADVILCDHAGRLLLVDPRYKPDWDMPCGMAEANEPPHEAVRRELTEELGLDIHVGPLLVVDWVSPHGPRDDLVVFIFDGGELSDERIASIKLVDDELAAFEFCTEEQARDRLRPYVSIHARCAIRSAISCCVQSVRSSPRRGRSAWAVTN